MSRVVLLHVARRWPVRAPCSPATARRTGAFSAERFLEDTLQYTDEPPSASVAPHKKHKAAGGGGGGDEDADMRAAMAASLQVASPQSTPKPSAADEAAAAAAAAALADAALAETAAAAAEAAAAAARELLPPEPAAGGVRLQLKSPSGERLVRSFPAEAPLSAVRAWALLSQPEAVLGRPFKIAFSLGGAAGGADESVAAALDGSASSSQLSVSQAGLGGMNLLFRWAC